MKDDTFVSQNDWFWMWAALALIALLIFSYALYAPVGGHNGGTIYGYTTGVIAALAMVFLMWYAARKRAYDSNLGTLKGWLGGHVWIGMALLIIVPLHSGFHFGWNVHTWAYVLIVLTVVTGIWGMGVFMRAPPQMQGRREGMSIKGALREINVLSTDLASVGKGKSDSFLRLLNKLDFQFDPNIWKILFANKPILDVSASPEVSEQIVALPKAEQPAALQLVSIAHQKAVVCNKLVAEVRLDALLRVWLYIHVPIATGAFALLLVHILSVFYRW